VFRRWNAEHGAKSDRISVWCPINVRASPFEGFGNGSSRIRIYDRASGAPWAERFRSVRAQVIACRETGEWALPPVERLLALPRWILRPLLRAYLDRPWVDMGSAPFSHAERLGDDALLPGVEEIELVGPLHERHPFGIFATTFRGRTSLTLTYDPALLEPADVARLLALSSSVIDEALGAL